MAKKVFCLLLCYSFSAQAGWRARAREHFYENHKLQLATGSEAEYHGLSNTINLWYEVPFDYSIGISLSPALGSSKAKQKSLAELGNEFQLQVYGLEAKYFPLPKHKLFTRIGLSYARLSSKNGSLNGSEGSSYYAGFGWEIPFYSLFLAPEIAIRKSILENKIEINTQIFALGFHFYNMF